MPRLGSSLTPSVSGAVGEPRMTKDKHTTHDFRVADATGAVILAVWDDLGAAVAPADILSLKGGCAGCLLVTAARGRGRPSCVHAHGARCAARLACTTTRCTSPWGARESCRASERACRRPDALHHVPAANHRARAQVLHGVFGCARHVYRAVGRDGPCAAVRNGARQGPCVLGRVHATGGSRGARCPISGRNLCRRHLRLVTIDDLFLRVF